MSANSLSHLLHATAGPEAHRSPTGPDASFTITTPPAVSNAPPAQPQQQQHHHHHHRHQQQQQQQQLTFSGHIPDSYSPVPPPPLLPSPSVPQPPPLTTAVQASTVQQGGLPPQASAGRSHSLTQSLYQCADCQRRYSRPEHLARHIQTHTLGKRFFCQVCGKAFARADLLKRHAANHDNDNDPSKKRRRTDTAPNAGRVSHACKACATARVKCEENKPCTRCRNRNLTCEYNAAEAGSAAALHLLHLSTNAHSGTVESGSPSYLNQQDANPGQPLGIIPMNTGSVSVKPETGQVPTPEAMADQTNQLQVFANPYAQGNMVDMAKMPFTDFLRDVLYDQSVDPARPDVVQGLSVLDFCDDTNYELTDIDFGLLDHWNLDETNNTQTVTQAVTPQTDDPTVDMSQMRKNLVKIWTNSPWRWIPIDRDSVYTEYGNLPISQRDTTSQRLQETQRQVDRVIKDKLDSSSRDKVLSVVLQTMKTDAMRLRIASSFPSADVMDTLTHIYLAAHLCTVSSWIHVGTLALNSQWPEWLGIVAAAGGVLTPVATLRKFGFAIQEAMRIAIPNRFEENNTRTGNLGLVQTLVLIQDVGLWSGSRRKMEISECHLLIPITMMRYRGKFQRSSYQQITVEPTDEGEVLEDKWRRWHEQESWKRLIFHCYLRDAETSITTLAPPTISYSELTLPLPDSKDLWFARSALEWKRHFLTRSAGYTKRPPSLPDIMRDINLLTTNYQRLDAQFAISIYLHCFWTLILEWRHLCAVHQSNSFGSGYQAGPHLILNSRHQDLCRSLQDFQLVTSDWHASLSAQESLLLNLLLMNLHVSMDDLQLFAGKEGEEQARRVYPVLQQWSENTEARQVVWHAGQILRQAKLFPHGHLKDFYAVGVHHAALALWAYGVVIKATRHQATPNEHQDMVLVDTSDSNQVQRFIGFGHGRPGIRTKDDHRIEPLDDPRACMNIVEGIFRSNFVKGDVPPPIVENICNLVKQLGGAAWAVGLS
ncbi:uncharacterized protein JN550_003463 [Neoarthrinium moseri]|uniref:uncharacterized protein n=1 Tax=Neoarthrinium moseri TaxID=1658444 RepID=UPI001FDBB626|nr:uncharacterized protein JN550_003463 [Neoarthrinium moseri]KAI1873210.1 hypothetical protein JN550_003463 [Neoarthrinium moseri]